MSGLQIVGRSSSLFTRLPLIFAEELAVPYELVPIHDMTALGSEVYAGNPALKLPILRVQGAVLFGALNICRAIDERAERPTRVVWPEEMRAVLSRNAQELVWHGMAAQVQVVFGTLVGKLPADNVYFAKARAGLEGSLRWLDTHMTDVMSELPARRLSVFEASLFCLVDHLVFRGTLGVEAYPSLVRFTREFSERPAAKRTAYRFDSPPPPA
ncbi:MAG: glutathione S-transferase family protein [Gammaproteobacteria bacterium]